MRIMATLRTQTPLARAARTAPCPHCGRASDRTSPFCSFCGLRASPPASATPPCVMCGEELGSSDADFCPGCGASVLVSRRRVATEERLAVRSLSRRETPAPRLALLDQTGDVARAFPLQDEVVVGRSRGTLRFDDDAMSAEHAVLTHRDNQVRIRDLGSNGASWHFVSEPSSLADGDLLLVGSQIIRFRELGTASESSRAGGSVGGGSMGSRTPPSDYGVLEQLRLDGSVRDVLHLSPGRSILIGREHGDWVFPYDPTMSARHAEVLVAIATGECSVRDLGSRNGVAIAVRGERQVRGGERILLGGQMLRVELE